MWDLAGTGIRQVATLIVSIVLARLLEPEQFGIIGIAMVFISITQVFIDVGFTDGLVQKKKVSEIAYSSIFYINILISLVLAVIIFLMASVIGSFYKSTQIVTVLHYLAIIPPITALGKVHSAILIKEFKFKELSIRDIIATSVGGGVGIVLAFRGFGVFSLVWQQVVSALIGSALLWIGTKWIPSILFSWKEVRLLLKFSSYVFFDQVIRQVFQKIDTLFIGKVFSPVVLGFYSRAESLSVQVTNYTSSSLQKVIFPVFSSIQDDDIRFNDIYFKAFRLAATLSITLSGVLFFLSQIIIVGLLGEKWAPSIIIFQILIFRTIFAPFGSLMGKALLSKGYSKIKFKVSLIQRVLMLSPMIFGFFYGIEIFTLAVVITASINFLISSYLLDYVIGLSFYTQIYSFVKPLIPLMFLVPIKLVFFPNLNSMIGAAAFLVFQLLYLILIKDSGLSLAKQEVTRIVGKH